MIEEILRELKELRRENEELRRKLKECEKKRLEAEKERDRIKKLYDALRLKTYSRKSEKILVDIPFLPFVERVNEDTEEKEGQKEEEKKQDVQELPKPRNSHGRRKLPKELPTIEERLEPDPQELFCTECNKKMRHVCNVVSEELEYIPGSFRKIKRIRPKYACSCGKTAIASLPPRPIDKGIAGPGLLAHVAVSKYADHIPLHRQEEIFKRQGVFISRSTLSDWMGEVSGLLEPIADEVKRFVLSQNFIQSDDTYVLVKDGPGGGTRRGYAWVFCIPWQEVVFEFSVSRGKETPCRFLSSWSGYLQTDAYGAYNELFRTGRVKHIGCFAHARRRFFEARKEAPKEAGRVLRYIQGLYAIESQAKEMGLSPQERKALRQEKALPILKELSSYLWHLRWRTLPQSLLGKAVVYALSHWESLVRYTEVGEAEIDNNSVENAIRHTALGRKNWLMLGSVEEGGERMSVFYTLIVTCKRLGIEPFAYLSDVIERVSTTPATRVWELTPRGWKEQREGKPSELSLPREKSPP